MARKKTVQVHGLKQTVLKGPVKEVSGRLESGIVKDHEAARAKELGAWV